MGEKEVVDLRREGCDPHESDVLERILRSGVESNAESSSKSLGSPQQNVCCGLSFCHFLGKRYGIYEPSPVWYNFPRKWAGRDEPAAR